MLLLLLKERPSVSLVAGIITVGIKLAYVGKHGGEGRAMEVTDAVE